MKARKISLIKTFFTPVLFGLLFWVSDAFLDAFVFDEGGLMPMLLAPEGDILWMRCAVLFIFIAFGIYTTLATKRKMLIEANLDKERNWIKQYLKASNSLVVALDRNQAVKLINQKGAEILGYPESEIKGKNWFDHFVPEAQREAYRMEYISAINGTLGAQEKHERHVLTSSGAERIISWHGVPLFDENNIFTGVIISGEDITERKELEERWKKYDFIVNTSCEFMTLINRDFVYDAVNESYARAHNKSTHEMVGKTVAEIWGEKLFSKTLKGYLETCFGGEEVHYQQWFTLPHSGLRYFDIACYPYFDINGTVSHVVVINHDITERIIAEEEMARTQSFLNSIIENIPHFVFVKDVKDMRYMLLNKASEKMFLTAREEITGKTDYDIFSKEIADSLRARDTETLQNGSLTSYPDERIILNDRGMRILDVKRLPLYDKENKPLCIMSIAEDITERKLLEDALRNSEEKYRSLFEESKDVIFICTPEGKITDINPAGIELFGLDTKSERWEISIPANLCASPNEWISFECTISANGFIKDHEFIIRNKTGKLLNVLVSANVIYYDNDIVIGYKGIMKDITERRKLEQQLFESHKMESIGLLAGGIAHDFNNLLTGILGYSTFLKKRLDKDEVGREGMEIIEQNAKRAAELTKQLLAFARGNRHTSVNIEVNPLVTKTIKNIMPDFDKSVEIKTIMGADIPAIEADAGQLQQAITNICVNARESMPGGGLITIQTEAITTNKSILDKHPDITPGKYVSITVTDTGAGMSSETLRRIFEPFFTTKQIGKGAGLGLSMVYGIVKNHKGFVDIESAPAHGTIFKIFLPANETCLFSV
ncbi:MAG: hypothetical protein A2219_07120 [Elusimicrobia bacterium RIFOXYA2_FULL_50_26]|nr:MAG: hypothetical protein A2219_07120 [Elusimicrobia bacterium RIFOXYA2_FULL_50_26]OGS22523.1 MAG: hypothetical protein A2314_08485 [Elusimicrobia bacterium RIFOXYB2_FULL_50_12]